MVTATVARLGPVKTNSMKPVVAPNICSIPMANLAGPDAQA